MDNKSNYMISIFFGIAAGLAAGLISKYFSAENTIVPFIVMSVSAVLSALIAYLVLKFSMKKKEAEEKSKKSIESEWGWLYSQTTAFRSGYPIKKDRILIGREVGCGVFINSESVSRRHAEIVRTPSGFLIKDLGSKNGTYVNGKRIEEVGLLGGEKITIGDMEFLFQPSALKKEEAPPSGEINFEMSAPDESSESGPDDETRLHRG